MSGTWTGKTQTAGGWSRWGHFAISFPVYEVPTWSLHMAAAIYCRSCHKVHPDSSKENIDSTSWWVCQRICTQYPWLNLEEMVRFTPSNCLALCGQEAPIFYTPATISHPPSKGLPEKTCSQILPVLHESRKHGFWQPEGRPLKIAGAGCWEWMHLGEAACASVVLDPRAPTPSGT